MAAHALSRWNPEDGSFWESEGRAIANRNLWISIPSLVLAFAVWMLWSVVVVNLPNVGFEFTTRQLFWLAALPSLCGATLRIFYSFMVPIFGGRRWTAISTASLLLPTLGMAVAVQDTATGYPTFVLLALLCGLGGGNFASSMANINFFFPKAHKGTALGLNAGLGNLGVSLVQFVVPLVVTAGLFGAAGGEPLAWVKDGDTHPIWLQNAGLVWVPFIVFFSVAAWLRMDDLPPVRSPLRDQASVLKNRHTWILCWLYLGTFGSFIGYSAGFPLLVKSEFPHINALSYAWLAPLVGALVRPLGGWLSDKLGGARVTLWNFVAMVLGILGVLAFLPRGGDAGNFYGFLAMFMVLFFAAGIGNGSTFRMIPVIFLSERKRNTFRAGGTPQETFVAAANRDAAAVLGFASALGAFGGFFIPMFYGASISMTGGASAALNAFIVFYLACIGVTWWFYARKNASLPC